MDVKWMSRLFLTQIWGCKRGGSDNCLSEKTPSHAIQAKLTSMLA